MYLAVNQKINNAIRPEDKKYKLHEVVSGFCRIYFKVKGEKTGQVFYRCIQEDSDGVYNLYHVDNNEWKEPSHIIKLQDGHTFKSLFELPKGESRLEKNIRNFILNN
jgi:hypothetical protein